MLGVTIGIGDSWVPVANLAADRMSEMTGLDCVVIKDWHGEQFEHPSWMKTRILDIFPGEESFLYFDADVWCRKRWSPERLFEGMGRKYLASPATLSQAIRDECKPFGLTPEKYINAGLMIFSHQHRSLFDHVTRLHPDCGRWFDQTPFNIALNEYQDWSLISRKYNAEATLGKYNSEATGIPLDDVTNIHWVSCRSAEQVSALQSL